MIEALGARGCDAVVLGCTEIPLLITDADSPLPVIDSTRTLARAAIREATFGKSGWVLDPEDNKVELRQPPEGQ